MKPASKPDDLEELSLDAAARLLGVPRIIVRKLIEDNVLPSRIDETGYRRIRRIPTAAVQAYRKKLSAKQNTGLQQHTDASERAAHYDAETADLPVRRKIDDGE